MRRKLKAAWRLLFCYGYVLCTVKKNEQNKPVYDHNLCEEDTLRLTKFITELYEGNANALHQAKNILGLDDGFSE